MILITVIPGRCTTTWRRGSKLCSVEFSSFKRKTRHSVHNSRSVDKQVAASGNCGHVQKDVRDWYSPRSAAKTFGLSPQFPQFYSRAAFATSRRSLEVCSSTSDGRQVLGTGFRPAIQLAMQYAAR